MNTRQQVVLGVAAAALAVTACGMAAGHSAGMPGEQAARVAAQTAPMSTSVTTMEDLVRVKRHSRWVAGYFAPVQLPQLVLAQRDLAKVKRAVEVSAARQPGSR